MILNLIYGVSFANGGPIDGSYVQKSGNIKLISKSEIELVKENLNIEIDGDYCNVEVTYILKNHGDESNVKYGFPVDFIPSDGYYFPSTEYIKRFEFLLNNTRIKYTTDLEDSVHVENIISNYGGGFKVSRKWYITEIPFKENSTQELKVKYRIMSNFGNYPSGLEYFSYYSERTFLYDLKPAGFWGNGTISEFIIKIKKPAILTPDEVTINGIEDLKFIDDICNKTIVDFNVNDSKILDISWDLSSSYMSDEFANSLPNCIVKNIRTSSQLAGNYYANYLIDNDYQTAWVEGKDNSGIGEWIEIEFNDNVIICGMTFLNGYTKSIETFNTNNKIKSYLVEISTKNGNEINTKTYNSDNYRELKNKSYKNISEQNYYQMLDLLFDEGDPSIISDNVDELLKEIGMTIKIKITIKDVFKGTKYDDACISELLFYGLKK